MSLENDDLSFPDELEQRIVSGEIPLDFQSVYYSGPFPRCVDCETELLTGDEVYSVIKAYVGKEPVFEMAICARCSTRLAESYSAESKAAFEAALRDWRQQRAVESARQAEGDDSGASPRLRPAPPIVFGDLRRLDHCAACGRPRRECRRYSIVGTFLGRALISPARTPFQLPILVCDACNGQMSENVSQQTRDAWDRFVDEHVDGPPGVELDLPRVDPVML